MKKSFVSLAVLIGLSISAMAQVVLGPPINDGLLPGDDDLICDIPLELDILEEDGPQEGDLVRDFTLYDTEDNMVHLQDILSSGRPVLLISSSYSCPVFRAKVNLVNNLLNAFSDNFDIYVVYTVEAHPYGDISPYYGIEATGDENFADGILIPQSDTYGERKGYAIEMKEALDLDAVVLIDDPCNNWWLEYGSSPNNAYVIDTNGLVYDVQIWLDRFPEDIYASMYGLLGVDEDGSPLPSGNFQLNSQDEDCVYGDPGSTIVAHAGFQNTDTIASYVDVIKISEAVPDGWETSLCTDICYPPATEVATMYIDPGSSQDMSVYFYTTTTGTSGQLNILVKNYYVPANSYELSFSACTADPNGVQTDVIVAPFYLFPNPASGQINAFLSDYTDSSVLVDILDVRGTVLDTRSYHTLGAGSTLELDISALLPGYYWIRMNGETVHSIRPFVVR